MHPGSRHGHAAVSIRPNQNGTENMSDVNVDDLGPVDYLVVEFPAGTSNFDGSMAAELSTLVDKGIIHMRTDDRQM